MNANPVLSLIIPVFNEEEAIEHTLRDTVNHRKNICRDVGLNEIEIIVVNDGSTDRTLEIARRVTGITIVSYKQNRGYGAAISAGFEAARGDFLAFMDADGTCKANFLTNLYRKLLKENADIVVGNRMHRDSKMPLIRRLGNRIFALVLTLLSGRMVRDSASGMRILRRETLTLLHSLPEGLNYTPAMSAQAVLDPRIKIVETDIPYRERQGKSKLNTFRDGLHFLLSIFTTAFIYSPLKLFGTVAIVLGVTGGIILGWSVFVVDENFAFFHISFGFAFLRYCALVFAFGLILHLFVKLWLKHPPWNKAEEMIQRLIRPRFILLPVCIFGLFAVVLTLLAVRTVVYHSCLYYLLMGFSTLIVYYIVLVVFICAINFILNRVATYLITPKKWLNHEVEVIEL